MLITNKTQLKKRTSTSSRGNLVNLWYVRAAIEQKLGLKLKLRQVAQYLYEEGLLTLSQADTAIFYCYNYSVFFDDSRKIKLKLEEEPKDLTILINTPTN